MSISEYRPSVGQTLLWFLDRARGEEGALSCPTLCRLRGPLNPIQIRRAVDEVVWRHEALRTTFKGGGRHLRAVVADSLSPEISEVDLSGEPDPEAAVKVAIAEELGTRIAPNVSSLRLTLWKLGESDHVLCFNMHHMITDSWSCNVVFEDLCAALDRDELTSDSQRAATFSEFAEQQRDFLSGPSGKQLRRFWGERLEDLVLPPLPMQAATPGALRDTRLVQRTLDADTVDCLNRLARDERSTMFVVLLTAFYRALGEASNTNDLALATLFANRSVEHRRTVGFVANMVLLRTRLTGGDFDADLRATHHTVMEAFVHQALPFQMLPVNLGEAGRRPDDIVFQMMADPVYSTFAGGLDIEVLVPDGVATRFELELVAVPDNDRIRMLLFFNPNRFQSDFAEGLLDNYFAICRDAIASRMPGCERGVSRRSPR